MADPARTDPGRIDVHQHVIPRTGSRAGSTPSIAATPNSCFPGWPGHQ
ncbi:hypothetical protein [Streptomyces chartreusis]